VKYTAGTENLESVLIFVTFTVCLNEMSCYLWIAVVHKMFQSMFTLNQKHGNIKKKSYPCNRPWRSTGLWEIEALTFSIDNRLTDVGKVVSLMCQPPFTPQDDSWYSFLLEAELTPGHSALGWIRSIEKIHLIGTRTCDLPACSMVPKRTTLPRAPLMILYVL
jgi:hypothetical protein